jgi:hypothetical protein
MAGKDNLITLDKRTKEEQRAIAKKGGKASGEARRIKKTCRYYFEQFRNMNLTDDKMIEGLKKAGVTDDDVTYGAALAMQTMIKAMKGNAQMMRLAFEMMGENDVQGSTTVNNNLPPKIEINFVGDDDE